jgi:dTDP-glucose 4,6-dehydratase
MADHVLRRVPFGRSDGPRIVVTGGAGFIGSWLCDALLEAGGEVICIDNLLTGSLDNLRTALPDPNFRLLQQDVSERLVVRGRVDCVFHLASPASPVHYQRHGIATLRAGSAGTINALELAKRNDARFVLASTSEIYGDPSQHPQTESYWGHVNPIGPRSVYDEAKRFAEAATMAYRNSEGVDAGIARIFNTYGPRMSTDDGRVIPAFIGQCLSNRPLTVAGDGGQTRSLCYVSDTVRGLLALAASSDPGPFNLGNPDEVTVLDLARRIRVLTGSESEIVHVPLPQDDPRRRCPDIRLAGDRLGWAPTVRSEDGLRRTIDWFRGRVDRAGRPLSALAAQGGHTNGRPTHEGAAESDRERRHELTLTTTGEGSAPLVRAQEPVEEPRVTRHHRR